MTCGCNCSTDPGQDAASGPSTAAATAADLAAAGLAGPVESEVRGAVHRARVARTFGEVPTGALLVLVDSAGLVALAVNRGSAATLLDTGPGDPVTLRSRSRGGHDCSV